MASIPCNDEKHREFKVFLIQEFNDATQREVANVMIDKLLNNEIEIEESDLK